MTTASDLRSYHGQNPVPAEDAYTGSAGFLKGLTRTQIREGIADLKASGRFRQMLGSHFPGKRVSPNASLAEALVEADAGFTIEKAPLFYPSVDGESAIQSKRVVALRRTDTGVEVGHAGPDYGVVQTIEVAAAAEVLRAEGQMSLESVQVVDGGSRVRVVGLIGSSTIDQFGRLAGDPVDVLAHFGVFEANHSGGGSCAAQLYTVRLACFNGMTTMSRAGGFRIRHTSTAQSRVEEASAALLKLDQAALAETALLQQLAVTRMTRAEFRDFAVDLIEDVRGPLEEDASEKKRRSRARAVEELELLFAGGAGNVGQTRYDAKNAVDEWIAPRRERFEKAKNAASRFAKAFESQATGYRAGIRDRALLKLTR